MRVLVTDGDNRAALAVTRSLGRAGHEVIVGEKQVPSLAHTSRYCSDRIVYPDPVTASDLFVEELARTATAQSIDVLLPVADITTFLVTRNRHRFPASCAIPFADADTVERAADKVGLLARAAQLGIAVPRSLVRRAGESVADVDLAFPVVIKPRQSRIRTEGGWVSTGVTYARDRVQLARDLASRPAHEFPVLLQERVVGPGIGVFAYYWRGRAVALFSHRRLRERPPWGGVSVLSESVPLCPLAREYATRLLDDLDWHGIAMVEFKRDVRDGIPKLMEINGRFWGSLQLAIDAGVDFPRMLVEHIDPPGELQPAYQVGVKSRWIWGDVDSLLLTLRGGNGASGRANAPRLRAILDFAKVWTPGLRYDNPKLDDARPWLFETYRWFRRIAHDAVPAGHTVGDSTGGAPRVAAIRSKNRHDVVGAIEEVGLCAAEWNALAAMSDTNSVFQTYEWNRAWSTVFGSDYRPVFIAASGSSAGARGVAALAVEQRLGEKVIRFIGDGRADYCDFLISGNRLEVLSRMFDQLRSCRWDRIELNNIPSHSSTVGYVAELCQQRGYWTTTDDQFPCPTLIIEGREADAAAVFHKDSLRRRQRYFERQGSLRWRHLTSAEEIEPYLDPFFEQHIARWKLNGCTSLFTQANNREFYRQLTRSLAPRRWLLFSIVEFNDRPIAFHYGFDYAGSVIWYKPSFDPSLAAHSPGLVMVRQLIGYALERRRRELDFTVGDEPFKRRFTNSVRKTVRIQIWRSGARYALELSRRKLMSSMKTQSR